MVSKGRRWTRSRASRGRLPRTSRFSEELVKRGFIVYAPQNPYRGGDRFRVLQRKSNPLKRSLFSHIIAQHEQTLDWLATLPKVDPKRIGFYGLSYGGKTAMRVPPLVERYGLSICSGDFTEWLRNIASNEERTSYLFTSEYEIPEWNLAARGELRRAGDADGPAAVHGRSGAPRRRATERMGRRRIRQGPPTLRPARDRRSRPSSNFSTALTRSTAGARSASCLGTCNGPGSHPRHQLTSVDDAGNGRVSPPRSSGLGSMQKPLGSRRAGWYDALGDCHCDTDLHATLLHLLGLDNRRRDVPGRERLDIDHGRAIEDIFA